MKSIPSRKLVFQISAVLLVTLCLLRIQGRSFWCQCGSAVPWSWDIWSSHNSQHLLDPYFFSHVLHGVLFFAVLSPRQLRISESTRWLIAVLIEAAWEILENSPMIIDRYRAATISLDYYGDSIANSVFDIIACILGYWIASSLKWYWSFLIFVAVELLLLLTIQDSLIVNVIMLIHPVEAIKQWQLG